METNKAKEQQDSFIKWFMAYSPKQRSYEDNMRAAYEQGKLEAAPPVQQVKRSTWRSDGGWKCLNCGHGITQHEGQTYCPPVQQGEADRDAVFRTCEVIVDILQDARSNSPESRCYADNAIDDALAELRALYTHPSPDDQTVRNAARYEWLRETWAASILEGLFGVEFSRHLSVELDEAIDAAMSAATAKKEG